MASKLNWLREQIARWSPHPQAVRIVAVSKGQPAERLVEAHRLGLRDFGESFVQEWLEKRAAVGLDDVRWHFIGRLQSNKLRRIAEAAACVQSLGEKRHAASLNRHCAALDKRLPVYLLVNAAEEPQKAGLAPGVVPEFAEWIAEHCTMLQVEGVMAIPPARFGDQAYPDNAVPELYQMLRRLADRVGRGQLSLGMSGDLRLALQAGSNCVRPGTGLFGPRH